MNKFFTTVALIGTVFAATSANAENVEIYLNDILVNKQNGYCIDIAGAKGASANPEDGLQGHTCYSPSGELGVDQKFDSAKFADGVLYMSDFDVCAELSSTEAGTTVDLSTCDGGDAQQFVFSGEGTIVPASAPNMCLTVAEATRSGRSDANQIKVLSLETCDAGKTAYQSWNVRSSAE